MTLDERLEALTHTVELLASMHGDAEKRQSDADRRQAEADKRQAEAAKRQDEADKRMEKRMVQLMDTMNRLGRILEAHDISIDDHEERIEKLEHPE